MIKSKVEVIDNSRFNQLLLVGVCQDLRNENQGNIFFRPSDKMVLAGLGDFEDRRL